MRVWEMNFVPNFKDRANTDGVHDYVIEFFTNPNSEWPQLFVVVDPAPYIFWYLQLK